MRPDFELCSGLHEGRHDVGHFGNAIRGVFTDAGQLAVFAGCEGFRLTPFIHSFQDPWHPPEALGQQMFFARKRSANAASAA